MADSTGRRHSVHAESVGLIALRGKGNLRSSSRPPAARMTARSPSVGRAAPARRLPQGFEPVLRVCRRSFRDRSLARIAGKGSPRERITRCSTLPRPRSVPQRTSGDSPKSAALSGTTRSDGQASGGAARRTGLHDPRNRHAERPLGITILAILAAIGGVAGLLGFLSGMAVEGGGAGGLRPRAPRSSRRRSWGFGYRALRVGGLPPIRSRVEGGEISTSVEVSGRRAITLTTVRDTDPRLGSRGMT